MNVENQNVKENVVVAIDVEENVNNQTITIEIPPILAEEIRTNVQEKE